MKPAEATSTPAGGRSRGVTMMELVVVLALTGILACVGWAALRPGVLGINAVQGEFKASLEQAILLAQAQGSSVGVSLHAPLGDLPPLVLPRGVRWGLPAVGVDFPTGMQPPIRAHLTGYSHDKVFVTPRGTSRAATWFLTDERDALCLRLDDYGRIQALRWRQRERRWTRF